MKKLMIMLILSAFSLSAFAYSSVQQDTTRKYRHDRHYRHHRKMKRDTAKMDTTKRVK